jgi:hypothetical protein
MNDQKENEVQLVREALAQLYLSAGSICPAAEPSPDVFVTLVDGSLIGIEVTRYHSDATGGGSSPNHEFASNWLRIQAEIRRHVDRHPCLQHSAGSVTPHHKRTLPGGGNADALGCELVDFAVQKPEEIARAGSKTYRPPFPDRYALMNRYVAELTLRPSGAASWACSGLGDWFRLDEDSLTASIRKKQQKTYDWGSAEERWLLVAAGAAPATVASWVGPQWLEATKLEGLDLSWITAFDRVLFFASSPSCWASEIWRAPGLRALPSRTRHGHASS